MQCFELRVDKVTPYIDAGRREFLAVGNKRVALDKSFLDGLSWFGRIQITDAAVDTTLGVNRADKTVGTIVPTSARGDTFLVKVHIGLNKNSNIRIVPTCKRIIADGKSVESVVIGGHGMSPPAVVTFDTYEALLEMQAGQALLVEETYEAHKPRTWKEFWAGVPARKVTVLRKVNIVFDGTTVRMTQSESY